MSEERVSVLCMGIDALFFSQHGLDHKQGAKVCAFLDHIIEYLVSRGIVIGHQRVFSFYSLGNEFTETMRKRRVLILPTSEVTEWIEGIVATVNPPYLALVGVNKWLVPHIIAAQRQGVHVLYMASTKNSSYKLRQAATEFVSLESLGPPK